MSFTSSLTGGLIADAPNYAGIAAKNEARRKGIIDLGLNQINAVFGGGTAPFYSVAAPNEFSKKEWREGANQNTYYSMNKGGDFVPYYAQRREGHENPTMPRFTGLFGFEKDRPTRREIVNERLKKGLLFTSPQVKTFEGYQPEFFQQRADAYEKFALPQVEDQYRTTKNAVTYGLANRGLGQSTVGNKARSDVERSAGQARQQVVDTGLGQANDLQRQVEQARQEAIRTLYASADPAQALQQATSAASQFERPSTFTPVANMFGNLAQQYYTNQLINNYKTMGQQYQPTYSLAGAVNTPVTY